MRILRRLLGCVQHTPLVPNYPLSYSLQSRSRESVSYTDAPAHYTGLNTVWNTVYKTIETVGFLGLIVGFHVVCFALPCVEACSVRSVKPQAFCFIIVALRMYTLLS